MGGFVVGGMPWLVKQFAVYSSDRLFYVVDVAFMNDTTEDVQTDVLQGPCRSFGPQMKSS